LHLFRRFVAATDNVYLSAIAGVEEVLQIDPGNASPRLFLSVRCFYAGSKTRADKELDAITRLNLNPEDKDYLAWVLALLGQSAA